MSDKSQAIEKRWTYKQLTDKTEEQIKHWLQNATDRPDLEQFYRQRANGAYDLWFALTSGWIEDGDIDRLRGLLSHQR